jgi:hypothetical protein
MQIMKEECIYNHLQAVQNRSDTTEIFVYKKLLIMTLWLHYLLMQPNTMRARGWWAGL